MMAVRVPGLKCTEMLDRICLEGPGVKGFIFRVSPESLSINGRLVCTEYPKKAHDSDIPESVFFSMGTASSSSLTRASY